MSDKCIKCGNDVGNTVFTVCDECWPNSELATAAGSESKQKFKIDWFTPVVPAMCLVSAITTMKSHAESVAEAMAFHLLGVLLVYVAILNLVNSLRRMNPPND